MKGEYSEHFGKGVELMQGQFGEGQGIVQLLWYHVLRVAFGGSGRGDADAGLSAKSRWLCT